MPPEFAQQLQQLFARQMAVVFLHRCAAHDVPLNLVSARLAELERQDQPLDVAALTAEFRPSAAVDQPVPPATESPRALPEDPWA